MICTSNLESNKFGGGGKRRTTHLEENEATRRDLWTCEEEEEKEDQNDEDFKQLKKMTRLRFWTHTGDYKEEESGC